MAPSHLTPSLLVTIDPLQILRKGVKDLETVISGSRRSIEEAQEAIARADKVLGRRLSERFVVWPFKT